MRCAAVLLLLLPLGLGLATGVAAMVGHAGMARNLGRGGRYILAAECLLIVALGLVGAVYQKLASRRDKKENPLPGRLIDVGGFRLHLVCLGEGIPTVVLESGLVGSWLDWSSVHGKIARFTKVCAYDRGGYGWSDPSPNPRTSLDAARELHLLLLKAGVEPPIVLVGHSMGGYNVRLYANLFREEVAGIVLLDASHPDEGSHGWRERAWIKFLRFTTPLGLPRWRGWCGNGPPEIRAQQRAFECRSLFYKTYDAYLGGYAQSVAQVRRSGSLGDLPLVVVMRDPKRAATPDPQLEAQHLAWQQDLSRLSSRGSLLIAERSGHAVMRDRPDIVVEVIHRVVQTVRAQPPLGGRAGFRLGDPVHPVSE